MFETALHQALADYPESPLKEAMQYALNAGGKRLRPQLFFSVLKAYGVPEAPYVDVALALEMIHTYSLVHDDLPAMDDDTLRRGQPTVHIQYSEWLAILVGDALQSEAFLKVAASPALSDRQKAQCTHILALKAGRGMVHGQTLDMLSENRAIDLAQLQAIHDHKTAHLIQASLMCAAVIAAPEDIERWETIGGHVGLLFQIQDDILEVTQAEATLGKSKTDERKHKQTYVSMLGLEGATAALRRHEARVFQEVEHLSVDAEAFIALFQTMLKRTH
jgi:geranylgeranyl diphosphate synthase type II